MPGLARLFALTLMCIAVLAVHAGAAQAGDVSVRDRGGVTAKGLTRAERSALDVQQVSARGAKVGLFVTVRFKGDFAARIGRGRLRRALAAIVLIRKDRSRPEIVATTGRTGNSRLLRRTRSANVGVLREEREITFFVLGGGLAAVKRIEVKVLRRLLPGSLGRVVAARPVDETRLAAPSLSDRELCRVLVSDYKLYDRRGRQQPSEELRALVTNLRKELARAGCITYGVGGIGFEHRPGEIAVCLDVTYNGGDGDLRSLEPLEVEVYRRQDDGSFVRLSPATSDQPAIPLGRRVVFTVPATGFYRVVVRDRDLPAAVEGSTEVPRPPPQATKDC